MPLSIQEELSGEGVGPITIEGLAQLLEVPMERLQPLIDHKYLRIVIAKPELGKTVISCPKPAVLEWLRSMFQPLSLRPLVRLDEVNALVRRSQPKVNDHSAERARKRVIEICRMYSIPIYQ